MISEELARGTFACPSRTTQAKAMVDFWGTMAKGPTTCGALAVGVAMSFVGQAEVSPENGTQRESGVNFLHLLFASSALLAHQQ